MTAEEARAATRKALEDKESEVGSVLDKIGTAILLAANKAHTQVEIDHLLKGLNRQQLDYILKHLRTKLGFYVRQYSDVREGCSTLVCWNTNDATTTDYYAK
jgi:4-hydroxyphenylpyruvate dioxygenase-like putative hemolysin